MSKTPVSESYSSKYVSPVHRPHDPTSRVHRGGTVTVHVVVPYTSKAVMFNALVFTNEVSISKQFA